MLLKIANVGEDAGIKQQEKVETSIVKTWKKETHDGRQSLGISFFLDYMFDHGPFNVLIAVLWTFVAFIVLQNKLKTAFLPDFLIRTVLDSSQKYRNNFSEAEGKRFK